VINTFLLTKPNETKRNRKKKKKAIVVSKKGADNNKNFFIYFVFFSSTTNTFLSQQRKGKARISNSLVNIHFFFIFLFEKDMKRSEQKLWRQWKGGTFEVGN